MVATAGVRHQQGSVSVITLDNNPALAQPAATGLIGAIGNTPLIRLRRLSEETGCNILGKAEFMNPGGSVKDRAGLAIIRAAQVHSSNAPLASERGSEPVWRAAFPKRM